MEEESHVDNNEIYAEEAVIDIQDGNCCLQWRGIMPKCLNKLSVCNRRSGSEVGVLINAIGLGSKPKLRLPV